jgi:hypothetical protein
MSLDNVLSSIDAEIARLQQARALLAGIDAKPASEVAVPKRARRKRTMSAEARKRIGEAQRKRWAAQKKAET